MAYVLLTLVLLPVQIVAIAARLKLAEELPRFYHALCLHPAYRSPGFGR